MHCPACKAENPEEARQCTACGADLLQGSEVTRPATDPNALLGRTVAGKFVLKEIIGAGAMGIVFRADQVSLGRTVAVKVLNATLARDESMVRRFHSETCRWRSKALSVSRRASRCSLCQPCRRSAPRASRTAQPGSFSWRQSRKRQRAASSVTSA